MSRPGLDMGLIFIGFYGLITTETKTKHYIKNSPYEKITNRSPLE